MPKWTEIWRTLVRAIDEFQSDDCATLAAALAYYAVFSLPPLLFLVAVVAGSIVGWEAVEARLLESMREAVGPAVAVQLQDEIGAISRRLKPDSVMVLGAGAFLVFAATGVLVQLQNAINRAWAVRPDPKRGFLRNVLLKRALSLGVILALTALMLVSFLASAALAVAGETIRRFLPEAFSQPALQLVDLATGLFVHFVVVAVVFRILPDARVRWRDVWIGSGVTAALLSAGRFGVSLYLSSRDMTQTFGPAAALAVLLLWVYYSAIIVLFGAEITHCWASRRGRKILPADGAVAVVKERLEAAAPTPAQSGRA